MGANVDRAALRAQAPSRRQVAVVTQDGFRRSTPGAK
jgi:hypothetical protein